MRTRFLIIISISVLTVGIILSLNFVITPSSFGPEHCPGLELRKSLGLVDTTSACL